MPRRAFPYCASKINRAICLPQIRVMIAPDRLECNETVDEVRSDRSLRRMLLRCAKRIVRAGQICGQPQNNPCPQLTEFSIPFQKLVLRGFCLNTHTQKGNDQVVSFLRVLSICLKLYIYIQTSYAQKAHPYHATKNRTQSDCRDQERERGSQCKEVSRIPQKRNRRPPYRKQ